MSDATEDRKALHAAIATGTAAPEGTVVTGWVCIAESMGPDGDRWLSRLSSDASGDRGLARWVEQGLLFNGLHGDGQEGWGLDDADDPGEHYGPGA